MVCLQALGHKARALQLRQPSVHTERLILETAIVRLTQCQCLRPARAAIELFPWPHYAKTTMRTREHVLGQHVRLRTTSWGRMLLKLRAFARAPRETLLRSGRISRGRFGLRLS